MVVCNTIGGGDCGQTVKPPRSESTSRIVSRGEGGRGQLFNRDDQLALGNGTGGGRTLGHRSHHESMLNIHDIGLEDDRFRPGDARPPVVGDRESPLRYDFLQARQVALIGVLGQVSGRGGTGVHPKGRWCGSKRTDHLSGGASEDLHSCLPLDQCGSAQERSSAPAASPPVLCRVCRASA